MPQSGENTGFYSTQENPVPIRQSQWEAEEVVVTLDIQLLGMPCTILVNDSNVFSINTNFHLICFSYLAKAFSVGVKGLKANEISDNFTIKCYPV